MATAPRPGARNQGGVRISKAGMESLAESLEKLTSLEVLVGVAEDSDVPERVSEKGEDLTNAALAYIHDNGAPEANIPARPFMRPGIEAVKEKLADDLGRTLKAVLNGGGDKALQDGLTRTGFTAEVSIKRTINEGIPPPLSDYTLRARMKSKRKNGAGARKGAAQELDRRWDGQAPSVEFAKPLVDTGQMRNSITHVIRKKG